MLTWPGASHAPVPAVMLSSDIKIRGLVEDGARA